MENRFARGKKRGRFLSRGRDFLAQNDQEKTRKLVSDDLLESCPNDDLGGAKDG
jgi:hypothetical protein